MLSWIDGGRIFWRLIAAEPSPLSSSSVVDVDVAAAAVVVVVVVVLVDVIDLRFAWTMSESLD